MAQRRQLDMLTKGRIVGMLESSRSQTEVSRILNVDQSVAQDCGRGFKEREMLPNNQYQVDQESEPLAKTDIWRLNYAVLHARRPAVCIPLTSAHKRARLNWSLKHQHWSEGKWANVMFSDESRCSLSSDSWWVTI
ncbi:transposable element Tcb2 transposase [Trichonephila clavipes]|nr:transposable element Tcb2 transposase [Trichonephila clavipes]